MPDRSATSAAGWIRYILGIPLTWKLVGANVVVITIVALAVVTAQGSDTGDREMVTILVIALLGSFVVNLMLVIVALRPIRALESTAGRVWRGDLAARFEASPLADRDVRRVGDALNLLLDHLMAERGRVRRLAAEAIRAGDHERAKLARELHDSTAQTLSAVVMQLAAAEREIAEPSLVDRVESIKGAALDALEEVRLLALTVHPRVLDDLGLPAALRHLARETSQRSGIPVDVQAPVSGGGLSTELASVLYRIAQEAVTNAVRHGSPTAVRVRLDVGASAVALDVFDDGRGFDVEAADRKLHGLGIFSMRERVALVDGSLEIDSRPGAGTRIHATVPIEAAEPARGA